MKAKLAFSEVMYIFYFKGVNTEVSEENRISFMRLVIRACATLMTKEEMYPYAYFKEEEEEIFDMKSWKLLGKVFGLHSPRYSKTT